MPQGVFVWLGDFLALDAVGGFPRALSRTLGETHLLRTFALVSPVLADLAPKLSFSESENRLGVNGIPRESTQETPPQSRETPSICPADERR